MKLEDLHKSMVLINYPYVESGRISGNKTVITIYQESSLTEVLAAFESLLFVSGYGRITLEGIYVNEASDDSDSESL